MTATQRSPHKTIVTSRIRNAPKILSPVNGSCASPRMYCPGFSSWILSAPATAAIGQPWLRLGVFLWSLRAILQAFFASMRRIAAATIISKAVKRVGMKFTKLSRLALNHPVLMCSLVLKPTMPSKGVYGSKRNCACYAEEGKGHHGREFEVD